MRPSRLLLPLLLSAVFAAPRDLEAWPAGAVAVCIAPGDQIQVVSISDGAGGLYTAWADPRGGNYDVYLQHLDASGEPADGYPFDGLLVGNGGSNDLAPQLALDASGDCWVVWRDSTLPVVLRRRLVPATVPPGFVPGGQATTRSIAASTEFVLCAGGTPGELFVFLTSGHAGTPVEMVTSVGGPNGPTAMTIGSEPDVNSNRSLRTVSDGAGGAFLVWEQQADLYDDLMLQHVVPGFTLAPGWPVTGVALCAASGAQESPTIAADGEGGIFAAWADRRSGNSDIYVTRRTATGDPFPGWTAAGTPLCTMTGAQTLPRLARTATGGVLVVWEDSRTPNTDVYAASLRADGVLEGNWPINGGVVSAAASVQLTPVIAPANDGSGYVMWTTLQGGTTFDVYTARVASHGGIVPAANGQSVNSGPNDQNAPIVVPGLANDAIVMWSDTRDGGVDLYAQRVVLGVPLDVEPVGPAQPALRVWPQPSRGISARVGFTLPDDQLATLTVLDPAGRVMVPARTIQGAGAHTLELASEAMPPGLYLVRLERAGRSQHARVVVMR